MCKSLETLKTNIAKGSNRLSKVTVKNIINEGCFERIELAYSYNGMEIIRGDIVPNPVSWFNENYDRLDVSLHKIDNSIAIITLRFHSNLWYNLFIDLKKNYTPTPNNKPTKQPVKQEQQTTQETEASKYIDSMQQKLNNGEATAEELKTYYIFMRDNTEEVKEALFIKISNSAKYKNKRKNTKLDLTDQLYNNMIEKLVYFVQDALSFVMDFSDMKGCKQRAIEEIIFSATDEMIQAQYNKNKAEKEARTEKIKETITAIENPQTLEDFRQVKLYRKDKTLTAEEQERYDYLLAIDNKEKKERQAQEKAEQAKATIIDGEYTIIADVDTRDNSPLWVVKLNNRVDKNEFNNIKFQIMKPLDGYYSRFKGGFIFKYDPTSKLLGEQPEGQEQEQKEEQSTINNSDKLRKVADNMQTTIDNKRADRQTNTARRARMAASAETDADAMEHKQGVLRNIANALDNQELKLIDKIDSKAQIDTLETILYRASWAMKTKENIDYKVWHETPMPIDVIKYAEIPSSTIYSRQLQSIINDIKNTDGFKLIANRFQKLVNNVTRIDADHDLLIDITGYEEELDKIYKNTDVLKNQYFETAIEERKRLSRIGIDSVEELRAYLREYWNYRTVERNTITDEQRKIRSLERQYKLDQKGDINFTPLEIALEMIEIADIDNNSKVLEPSAGIGNIADQIKKYTNNLDVCEQMCSYCELLKLKGHNVVGNDFLQYNNPNYYDCIIMNPPFSDEQNHIKHAYDLLVDGGKLISITSPHWTFANERSSREFKEWFNSIGGEIIEELDSGTFEMTGVRTQIIVINKDEQTAQKAI